MKKATLMILALVLLLSLGACGKKEESKTPDNRPLTSVSAYKSKGNFGEYQGQLTWEKINAFPLKRTDMTVEEMRTQVVDFFRFTKSALWIPAEDYVIPHSKTGELFVAATGGQVYGSLPYVSVASGNIYRLMDYMDEETGVVNIAQAGKNPQLFGNQCSFGAWCGWARVINSANYAWTFNCVTRNNFVPVGEPLYEADLKQFSAEFGTDEAISTVDQATLFKNYALLQKGDGIVNYNTAGHVVMISDIHVEYDEAGNVDPGRSYVTVIDQAGEWVAGRNEYGETYTYTSNADVKWNFMTLRAKNYVPFTYKEFLGEDPVEETQVTLLHEGATITKAQVETLTVRANYGIMDLYVEIHDAKGNEVMKTAARCTWPDRREVSFKEDPETPHVVTWGGWENVTEGDKVTIYAQLGTGERPVLWEGTFAE